MRFATDSATAVVFVADHGGTAVRFVEIGFETGGSILRVVNYAFFVDDETRAAYARG